MSLIINIQNLPEEGINLREELDRSWLANIPEYCCVNDQAYVKDNIKISGHLVKEGNNLRLRGKVELVIKTLCSRCGKDVDYNVDSRFDLVLMPRKDEAVKMERELTPEDLDRLYYTGVEVDLTPYFHEQIALEIPMQFLCCPECKGVCPNCGANLNTESCRCLEQKADPRLAVLRQLKIGK